MGGYQHKYKWHRTKIDANDVPTNNDWSGYDGEIVIGRIQKQPHGPMKDRWLWSGHGPRVRERNLPHQGYEAEGREAMRRVEEYYERLMAANGLSPGVK
ncbi:hypothetical protein [Rhizobium sp. BK060]|uniref:hypothetical protein n=1 Tax=Rhizobium sp. BK060 TaxID=2587096 RepID=UPI00160A99D9|nr:hypothetical protein [Rhizobium sp. BK060]MBB3396894.1 hypothetical protein [Rhizobium sp. BK060]